MQSRTMTMFAVMAAAMMLMATPTSAQIPENSVAGVAVGVDDLSTLVDAILLASEGTEGDQLDLLVALSNPEDALTVR